MDYSKSGGANAAKTSPKPKRGAQKGAPKSVTPPRETKDQLLARMKAAAAQKNPGKRAPQS